MKTYEVILDGHDGESDVSDHMELWIVAHCRADICRFLIKNNQKAKKIICISTKALTSQDGVDFTINKINEPRHV